MPFCAGYRISSMRCCTTLPVVVLFARILLFSSSYLFRTLMSTTAAFLEPCLIYLNISLRGYLRLYSHGWWRLLLHASHLRYAESRTCCVKTHQIQHCFLRLHCSIQSDACALASIPALSISHFKLTVKECIGKQVPEALSVRKGEERERILLVPYPRVVIHRPSHLGPDVREGGRDFRSLSDTIPGCTILNVIIVVGED